MNSPSCILSQLEQEHLLEKLQIFKIQGRDKRGRQVLHIIAKHFPARMVSSEALKMYLEEKIYPKIGERPFSMVYMRTGVQKCENFPGISTTRLPTELSPRNGFPQQLGYHPWRNITGHSHATQANHSRSLNGALTVFNQRAKMLQSHGSGAYLLQQ